MRILERFNRKPKAEVAVHILVSVLFMAVALSYLFILVWTFFSGLSTHEEIIMNPFSFPEKLNWKNFIDVFSSFEVNDNGFFQMLFNSIWFSVVGVLINQFVSMSFAYCCTKYVFPGSKLPKTIILIMLTLPLYGTAGATYKLTHDLGLIDSYWHVITSAAGFNVFFLYYSAYFQNTSSTYAEAAMLDGANDFQIYFRIMIPIAKPLFGALFLSSWLTNWNAYEGVMVSLPNLPTLPVGIYEFYTEMVYRGRMDIMFAACCWVALPAIILFVAFNKLLTTNVTVGGIKG